MPEPEPDPMEFVEVPPWLASLREAMSNAIQGDDLKAIMAAQIEKAKAGDMKAAAFVFGQAHKMMQTERRPVSIVQNNFYGDDPRQLPDAAADAEGKSRKTIGVLQRRAAAGLPLKERPDSRRLSDEEEKEFRRLQQEEEAQLAAETGPEGD